MARERYLLNAGEDTIHDNEIKLVTAKDKRKNWWYYHKRHLLVGIIAAAMVGSLIYSLVSQVEPDYTIGLLTSYSMPDVASSSWNRALPSTRTTATGTARSRWLSPTMYFRIRIR